MYQSTGELEIDALAACARGNQKLWARGTAEERYLLITITIALTTDNDCGTLASQVL
jgi:hypothetical protein